MGLAVLTCKSCLAASAPALVLKVTKPTGCKERNSHELSFLDLIISTIVKGPVCYVKILQEDSPTRVAVLSAIVANGGR